MSTTDLVMIVVGVFIIGAGLGFYLARFLFSA
jgi:hypothetical protein